MGETLKWQEYKCHKVVQAVKITDAVFDGTDLVTIHPSDASVPVFTVTKEWWTNRSAKVGGYAVLYSDGYMSWSPAKEFDDGYTKMDGGERPQLSDGRTKARFEYGMIFGEGGLVDAHGVAWWCKNGKLTLCEIDPIPEDTKQRGIGWAVKQMWAGQTVRRRTWPPRLSATIVGGAIKGNPDITPDDVLGVDWTFA